jgi:hypothetical protein
MHFFWISVTTILFVAIGAAWFLVHFLDTLIYSNSTTIQNEPDFAEILVE